MAVRASYYAKKYPNTHIKGFEKVMKNLNGAIARMRLTSERGLVNAAAYIRNDTEKVPYITPLDLGNLQASWFIVSRKGVEADPIGRSGRFRNNKRRHFTSAQFRGWHNDATTEARALVGMNPARVSVMMGYSAIYAMWVHEMIGKHFKRPDSGPRWFQDSIDRSQSKIKNIIRETSKIPGTK